MAEEKTFCSKCGVELEDKEGENYLTCKKCNRLTPRGSNSLHIIPKPKPIVKGGNRMKTVLKEELAAGCIEFLEQKSVAKEDMTKVLSTAYRNAAEARKKNKKNKEKEEEEE